MSKAEVIKRFAMALGAGALIALGFNLVLGASPILAAYAGLVAFMGFTFALFSFD